MISDESYLMPRLPLKRHVVRWLHAAMYWCGAASTYVSAFRVRGAVVLMYHSVSPAGDARWIAPRNRIRPKEFEAQMRFLSRHRKVMAMDQLVQAIERGEPPEAGTVVITFDDGYHDLLTVAAPIMESYGLPAIVYLPTGQITSGEPPWSDDLYTMFRARTKQTLIVGDRIFDLRSSVARRAAYSTVHSQMIRCEPDERRRLAQSIEEQLHPLARTPRITLSWEQVRDMVRRFPFIAVGVHTVNHVDLSCRTCNAIRDELQQCQMDVEREMGTRPLHFSFPYNRACSDARSVLVELGYRSAVCSGDRCLVDGGSDRFILPRIDVPRSMTLFRFCTSGAYPGLSQALLGRI